MSDDKTLLTRKEVEATFPPQSHEVLNIIGPVFYARLLRTVDTAHGLLQAELKAAVDEGVAAMINEANERAETAEKQLDGAWGEVENQRKLVAALRAELEEVRSKGQWL